MVVAGGETVTQARGVSCFLYLSLLTNGDVPRVILFLEGRAQAVDDGRDVSAAGHVHVTVTASAGAHTGILVAHDDDTVSVRAARVDLVGPVAYNALGMADERDELWYAWGLHTRDPGVLDPLLVHDIGFDVDIREPRVISSSKKFALLL